MQKVNDRLYNWATDIDPNTILQSEKAARLPIVQDHIALMPDAHVGMGCTVGSVVPTKGAVCPSFVGVDIGCGMIAVEMNYKEDQLPDDLTPTLRKIEEVIPAGVGQGHNRSNKTADQWLLNRGMPVTVLSHSQEQKILAQFGTLGSGNHFLEICVDERQHVWIVLHSGSRGIGNQLAQGHIKQAKALAKILNLRLEDPDLAYFVEGTPQFRAYIHDMLWAQDYARANRDQMMNNALRALAKFVPGREMQRINCHHNFTQKETWNGQNLWITRKGAIKADVGDLGVIPGSMGTRSYIVKGKGNQDSWNSCSHGAGRRHSRTAAKKLFTVADLEEQMDGKTWMSDRGAALLDEIPASYKDIDVVMDDQKDLVEILHTLHQVLNFKGV